MSIDWKSLVKSVAPTLGAALGGPASGMAVKFLAETFLGNSDATEADLASAVQRASPDQMIALKELDQDFAIKMRNLDIDVFRLEVTDRQNARDLFRVNIWPQVVLSAVFVVGYFIILGLLVAYNDAQFNDRVFGILNTIMGVLTAAIPMILQFWFGSSTGSKEKDRLKLARRQI